jgi:hypothetical protein
MHVVVHFHSKSGISFQCSGFRCSKQLLLVFMKAWLVRPDMEHGAGLVNVGCSDWNRSLRMKENQVEVGIIVHHKVCVFKHH